MTPGKSEAAAAVLLSVLLAPMAQAQAPVDHVGQLRQSLLTSREHVQEYEWIETRVLSLGGEEKSRTQSRCAPQDAVALDARFAALKDGTTYPDVITLRAPAKKLQVTIDNSGYRKMAN